MGVISDEASHTLHQGRGQTLAPSSEEALWRVVKRVGSSLRWLKLDLALLAKQRGHDDVVQSLEVVVQMLGAKLLPDLGESPIKSSVSSRAEVIDLVGLVGAIG